MKKLICIFTVLTVLLLSSCRQNPETRVFFDRKEFLRIKDVWRKQNLENYSFSYEMDISYYIPLKIEGQVTVKKGKGSVAFKEKEPFNIHEDYPVPRAGSPYYITCIEDIFKGFYESYVMDKDSAEHNENLIVVYSFSYDKTQFYPLKCYGSVYDKTWKKGMVGNNPMSYCLHVTDFKITE